VLDERGHDVVPMSRATGVDVITAEGLPRRSRASTPSSTPPPGRRRSRSRRPVSSRPQNLQEVGARVGVRRLVAVSIIGADHFTAGYGAAKIAHEQATLAGPIPARVVRAAQFHEFVEELIGWGRQGDVSHVPDMRTQLVAARTVAEALADLATDADSEFTPEPAGVIPEIAGPREESLVETARLLVARRGETVRIEGGSDPSDPDRDVYSSGALLPGPDATLAGPTFVEWLDANVVARSGR
jgi:hypothetical protein